MQSGLCRAWAVPSRDPGRRQARGRFQVSRIQMDSQHPVLSASTRGPWEGRGPAPDPRPRPSGSGAPEGHQPRVALAGAQRVSAPGVSQAGSTARPPDHGGDMASGLGAAPGRAQTCAARGVSVPCPRGSCPPAWSSLGRALQRPPSLHSRLGPNYTVTFTSEARTRDVTRPRPFNVHVAVTCELEAPFQGEPGPGRRPLQPTSPCALRLWATGPGSFRGARQPAHSLGAPRQPPHGGRVPDGAAAVFQEVARGWPSAQQLDCDSLGNLSSTLGRVRTHLQKAAAQDCACQPAPDGVPRRLQGCARPSGPRGGLALSPRGRQTGAACCHLHVGLLSSVLALRGSPRTQRLGAAGGSPGRGDPRSHACVTRQGASGHAVVGGLCCVSGWEPRRTTWALPATTRPRRGPCPTGFPRPSRPRRPRPHAARPLPLCETPSRARPRPPPPPAGRGPGSHGTNGRSHAEGVGDTESESLGAPRGRAGGPSPGWGRVSLGPVPGPPCCIRSAFCRRRLLQSLGQTLFAGDPVLAALGNFTVTAGKRAAPPGVRERKSFFRTNV